jgi:hypothetical protein
LVSDSALSKPGKSAGSSFPYKSGNLISHVAPAQNRALTSVKVIIVCCGEKSANCRIASSISASYTS